MQQGAADGARVLRGHALEIIDDRGPVRAGIAVLLADPAVKMPDGTTGYPETVLLRLSTSVGRPGAKLATTGDGAALVLLGRQVPGSHVPRPSARASLNGGVNTGDKTR